ncbi:hypothetical protein Tco_1033171 [Tanacetum coccineum]|uniref:Uncharacterized protein n=1 Tax=Tanacetum coccineum TaxID=301880 RepID=A0ABQ5GEI0_9ASTR
MKTLRIASAPSVLEVEFGFAPLDIKRTNEKDPNDYDPCAPNSHHEDEEVSSDEDVDEWLNAELGNRMTGKDKEEEDDALIDILKIVQSTHPRSKVKRNDESIDTVDSSDDMQELEGSQEDEVGSHPLENVVSRWHVSKPIRVTVKDCEKDCEMLKQWICFRDHERHKVEGNGMIYADFLKVRYGNKNIDDVTRKTHTTNG